MHCIIIVMIRRGSRINTDRFPKRALKAQTFSGVQGLAPQKNYLDFYSSESPFLGFWVIQMGYWPGFNLESVFILKIYFIWKMWPISVKRWKPVWIRTWWFVCLFFMLKLLQYCNYIIIVMQIKLMLLLLLFQRLFGNLKQSSSSSHPAINYS